jgi:hypothetical protein
MICFFDPSCTLFRTLFTYNDNIHEVLRPIQWGRISDYSEKLEAVLKEKESKNQEYCT